MDTLSPATTTTAGIVLLTVAFIAYGGTVVLRATTGAMPANDLQRTFFRAGHAHAGVLVILGMVVMLYVDLAGLGEPWTWLSRLVLLSAILMSAGFFLSVIGRDPQRPNRWIALLWLGAAVLVIGVVGSGVGLVLG